MIGAECGLGRLTREPLLFGAWAIREPTIAGARSGEAVLAIGLRNWA